MRSVVIMPFSPGHSSEIVNAAFAIVTEKMVSQAWFKPLKLCTSCQQGMTKQVVKHIIK